MTAVGLLLAGLGVVLMTAGVKDLDPREMVLGVVKGNPTATGPGTDAAIGAYRSAQLAALGYTVPGPGNVGPPTPVKP